MLLANWFGKILRQLRPAPVISASSAAQKYTPSGSPVSTSSLRRPGSAASGSAAPAPSRSYRQSSGTNQQIPVPTPSTVVQTESWILFGVKGASRTLTPTQISVNSQATDSSVFQEFKKCYQLRRGRLRLWFSIWRLEYCESVKVHVAPQKLWTLSTNNLCQFHRLTLDRMVRDYRELPTHQDYQYRPRAPAAQNPPFGPHLFQALFYTCSSPCTWLIPHDCIPPPAGNSHLERIPKRRQSFERDLASPIWGFEAVYAVSLAYVLAYHFIILAGPFAFWGLWLKLHPDDLQNATVPMTIVLAGLSLFWSGAGILTSRGHD